MTRTRVMSPGKEGRNADFMQTARDNPHKAEARIGASTEAGTRNLRSQSSVYVSQATLSQATLSQATLSQTTLSQAKLSQATLFQTRVSQVSSDQKMPPNSGSIHCSGEPKRTGYCARAKPSAGRSPRLAQATGAGLESMPIRSPPDGSPGLGAASHGTARVAAFASSSPLPSAM